MNAAVKFILEQIRRFRWMAMWAACIVCLIGWLIETAFPHAHTARVQIDTPGRLPITQAKANRLQLALCQITGEIADTQGHLDELLLRYNDKHPVVVSTRKELEQLKEFRARLQAEIATEAPVVHDPRLWLLPPWPTTPTAPQKISRFPPST